MTVEAPPVVPSPYPELELVDSLIAGLEALIHESDETPLHIDASGKPRRLVYRILAGGGGQAAVRKLHLGEAVFLNEERLVIRCSNTEVVRQMQLEVTIQAEKSGRGEAIAVIKGKVREMKRIRGGYDMELEVKETHKMRVTPGQKLRECLRKNDVSGWNRWCQDIPGNIELSGLDLRSAELVGYDLCCADLSGTTLIGANLTNAILAGADLRECDLGGATVQGADFFRARMRRAQASLLAQSGMSEVESVIFDS